jgi:hypothetical protein
MELATVLTSGVVAGLVAGLVSLRTSERKIQIDNITQERAKWREKIRSTAVAVHKAVYEGNAAALSEARLTFQLLLNPFDSEDMGIIESITALMQTPDPKPRLPEFAGRVSYLLKHDWERAKYEARSWAFGFKRPTREIFRTGG